MGLFNFIDKLKRAPMPARPTTGGTAIGFFKLPGTGGYLMGYGDVIPTVTTAGWCPGGVFIKTGTTVSTAGFYINIGTATSCNFVSLTAAAQIAIAGFAIPTSQTLAVTTADLLTVGGIIVPQRVMVTHKINPANTSGEFCFVADRAYTVVTIKEIHNVVAGQACVCSVRKITSAGTALADATLGATVIDILSADLDLTTTAAVTVTASLSAVAGAITLAAGDKIGIKMGNGSSLVGGNITIQLKAV